MKKFVLILLFVFGLTLSATAMTKGGDDYPQEQVQVQMPIEKHNSQEPDDNMNLWIGIISTLVVGCVTPITIAWINNRKNKKE